MRKILSLFIVIFLPATVFAQDGMHHTHAGHAQAPAQGQVHDMSGFYGGYPHTRESSGTSWQPESSPMLGRNFSLGQWNLMIHGYVLGIYDHQGGKKEKTKGFSQSMFMLMASRSLGKGTIGYRSMYSLDPLMGKRGYPLLFQTGESYDGIHPLVDRQHPHDFFMEEALTYSLPTGATSSVFVYAGLPGEPALGPPAFMHRFSAMDNPEAPLSHHWLDSTHITFGVLTLGYILDKFKLEASAFRGREPNEKRWDIETPKLDSYSARLTFNPGKDLSLQASYGYLDSPEQLEPQVNVTRATFSAMYNRSFPDGNFATTFAWGLNDKHPGLNTQAYLWEAALNFWKANTVFSRFEYVQKDELFDHEDSRAQKSYPVKKLSLGYVYDFIRRDDFSAGVGGVFDTHFVSGALKEEYGHNPKSYMLFLRIKV